MKKQQSPEEKRFVFYGDAHERISLFASDSQEAWLKFNKEFRPAYGPGRVRIAKIGEELVCK